MDKTIFIYLAIAISPLWGCKSQFNDSESSDEATSNSVIGGDYLPLSGGTLTGSLSIPANSLQVGTDQIVAVGGRVGIGTAAPTATLTVDGLIESTVGIEVPDGTIATQKIADSGVVAGSYGGLSTIPTITVNSKGLITGVIEASVSSNLQYGLKFEYVDDASLRLTPSGLNGEASIVVFDGTDLLSININANLSASLAATGAGGLDTGAEASNTGYDIYLITEAGGANPQLLLTVSGDNPTLPAGYTHQSEVLWFVSNSQGGGNSDIVPFVDLGNGRCLYLISNGVQVLSDGENTAVTAVGLSRAVPSNASTFLGYIEATNLDLLTTTNFRLYYDSAGTVLAGTLSNLRNTLSLGLLPTRSHYIELPLHSNVASSLFYAFSSAPLIGDFGANIYVQQWSLASRMSR